MSRRARNPKDRTVLKNPPKLFPATAWGTVVGRELVCARVQCRQSQGQMAKAVGVTKSTWCRIEQGRSALTIEQLTLAAAFVGVGPEDILRRASAVCAMLRERGVHVLVCPPEKRDQKVRDAGLVLVDIATLDIFSGT